MIAWLRTQWMEFQCRVNWLVLDILAVDRNKTGWDEITGEQSTITEALPPERSLTPRAISRQKEKVRSKK